MNERTKKLLAGMLLGTLTIASATPVYAAEQVPQEKISITENTLCNSQHIHDMPLAHSDGNTEKYGVKGITLKALKQLIDVNWTRITTFLVDISVDIEIVQNLNDLKSTFFSLLDTYFDVSDTAHEAIRNSLGGLGLSPVIATIIADAICLIIF